MNHRAIVGFPFHTGLRKGCGSNKAMPLHQHMDAPIDLEQQQCENGAFWLHLIGLRFLNRRAIFTMLMLHRRKKSDQAERPNTDSRLPLQSRLSLTESSWPWQTRAIDLNATWNVDSRTHAAKSAEWRAKAKKYLNRIWRVNESPNC